MYARKVQNIEKHVTPYDRGMTYMGGPLATVPLHPHQHAFRTGKLGRLHHSSFGANAPWKIFGKEFSQYWGGEAGGY